MTGGPRLPVTVASVLAGMASSGPRSTWAATLVEDCAASLGAAGAGLAVADATGPVGVVAATAGAGQAGEDLQFALGEGPCRVAAQTRRAVHAPALSGDGRWLQFAPEAGRAGIEAAFSVPLQVGAVLIGVLDVYQGSAGPLPPESVSALSVYGEAATAVLLLLSGVPGGPGDDTDLGDLADIRPVVHQASGMVAVQLDVNLSVALLRLRGQAFASGMSLRELASDVVARRIQFDHTRAGVHVSDASEIDQAPGTDLTDDSSPAADESSDRPDRPDFKQRNPNEHP